MNIFIRIKLIIFLAIALLVLPNLSVAANLTEYTVNDLHKILGAKESASIAKTIRVGERSSAEGVTWSIYKNNRHTSFIRRIDYDESGRSQTGYFFIHRGPHWDVQNPKTGGRSNIYPGGRVHD